MEAYLVQLLEDSQFVHYTCQMSHHLAKRHASGEKNLRREDINHQPEQQTPSFSGPPKPPKGNTPEKL